MATPGRLFPGSRSSPPSPPPFFLLLALSCFRCIAFCPGSVAVSCLFLFTPQIRTCLCAVPCCLLLCPSKIYLGVCFPWFRLSGPCLFRECVLWCFSECRRPLSSVCTVCCAVYHTVSCVVCAPSALTVPACLVSLLLKSRPGS